MLENPEPIVYRWKPEGVGRECNYQLAGGCAIDGEVVAGVPVIVHELVHAYASRFGRADPFLEEGLAEYLGGHFRKPARGDPTLFYGGQRHLADPSFYGAAGRFVGQLITSAGIERFLAFYAASGYDDPADVLEGKLSAHLGLEVEDVVFEMGDTPACSSFAYREKPILCGRVAMEINPTLDNPTTLSHDFDCASSDILGTDDQMSAYQTISIPADTGLLHVDVDEDTEAMLIPCAPLCEGGDLLEPEDLERGLELLRGTYAIRLARTVPGTAEIRFRRN